MANYDELNEWLAKASKSGNFLITVTYFDEKQEQPYQHYQHHTNNFNKDDYGHSLIEVGKLLKVDLVKKDVNSLIHTGTTAGEKIIFMAPPGLPTIEREVA